MLMKQRSNHSKACIFDFDSTIVSIETLDFLISNIAGQGNSKIHEITNQAMGGNLSFGESLKMRFTSANLTKDHVIQMQNVIYKYITQGVVENITKLQDTHDLYIISGGFLEIMYPVAEKLQIPTENCFANEFLYNNEDIIGYNSSNPLADSGGKPKVINNIYNNYDKVFMIGDGYTDLEVSKEIPSIIFCGFGQHAIRQAVLNEAKHFFYNFEDLTAFILKS
jgi:HAD superfamily phosphoserine phosphatase-like hydrolase